MPPHPARILSTTAIWLATIWVGFVAIRIEFLNARLGYMLPRGADDTGKWRVSGMTEERWRAWKAQADAPEMLTRPLTSSEQTEMKADIERSRLNATLRGFVSTAGLLQYPISLMLFPLAIAYVGAGSWRPHYVAIRVIPALVAAIAIGLAFYRGYFTSLGG